MFTKQNAKENKEMFQQALKLLAQSGYKPAEEWKKQPIERRRYVKVHRDYATKAIQASFPDVSRQRISTQVGRAKMTLYSRWVKERGF